MEAQFIYPSKQKLFRAGIAESSAGPLYVLFVDLTQFLRFNSTIAKTLRMLAPMMNRENLSFVSWAQLGVQLGKKLFHVCSKFLSR